MPKEIERKFLLKETPHSKYLVQHQFIKSIYLLVIRDKNKNIRHEIRIKYNLRNHRSYLTYKKGGSLSRTEIEIRCPHFIFNIIEHWRNPIVYECCNRLYGSYLIEYATIDNKFTYAEIEFPTESEAKAFEWPWPNELIKDATYDNKYKMANYWKDRNKIDY